MTKPKITEEDKNIFRAAVRGVKPLASSTKVKIQPSKTKVIPPVSKQKPTKLFAFSDEETREPVTSDTYLEFSQPGIQHKTLRNLRRGQYNVQAILDLHGMTVVEARESLSHFLAQCQRQGLRYALVIHGKGHGKKNPILKNKLNHWLRQTDYVLAFCSATAKEGRTGALYLLLKNQKGETECG